jgi:hypothetical protein
LDTDVAIFKKKPIVGLYIKCCTSRGNGTSMAHINKKEMLPFTRYENSKN